VAERLRAGGCGIPGIYTATASAPGRQRPAALALCTPTGWSFQAPIRQESAASSPTRINRHDDRPPLRADRTQDPSSRSSPAPQRLRTDRAAGQVTISCQVSDIDVTWHLAETTDGTTVTVRVELTETETHRLDGQRELITKSLRFLGDLAEAAT
jgi:hypothetical protein